MPRVHSPSTGRFLGSTAPGYAGREQSLIYSTFQARDAIRLLNRLRGEAKKIDAAATDAHERLAAELQGDIAKALTQAVEAGGREQKIKNPQDRLAAAIRSERNRRVNARGYTVGYLNEIEAVRPYYRGLETGTSVHVGRFLSGVFTDNRGYPSPPMEGGKDARFFQRAHWRTDAPYRPGVRIKRPITGYRYFENGQATFIARGGTRELAVEYYNLAFAHHGLDLLLRAMNRGSGNNPSLRASAGHGPNLPPLR